MRCMVSTWIFTVLLTGCLDNRTAWDGNYNQLPELGRSCVLSWVGNIYSIESVESEIEKLGFSPSKILLLKSATTDMAAYNFLAILEKDGEVTTIVGGPRYIKPLVKRQNEKAISELLSNAQNLANLDSSIISGKTSNLNHVPCDFLYYKSGTDIRKYAFVGLFESEEENQLVSSLKHLLLDTTISLHTVSNGLVIPPQEKMEILKRKVQKNVFFELDVLDGN